MRKRNLTILTFFTTLVLSCSNKVDQSQIAGSWQLLNVAESKENFTSKAIFDKQDNLKIIMLSDGMVVDSLIVKYSISANKKYLTTGTDSLGHFKFEILELNKESLITKNLMSNQIDKYSRITD
jgi:hypothetical protein